MESWLRELSLVRSPFNGEVVITNMHKCIEAGLLTPADLRRFVEECMKDGDSAKAGEQFRTQCKFDAEHKIRFTLQCAIGSSSVRPYELLVTVVSAGTFLSKIVHPSYTEEPTGSFSVKVLPPEINGDRDRSAWKTVLQEMSIGDSDWLRPDATLGKPYDRSTGEQHRICWFSIYSAMQDALGAIGHPDEERNEADIARDALGLKYRDGDSLVEIRFSSSILDARPVTVAQPTFIDAGTHPRFAAEQSGGAYELNRRGQWGTTVDLFKLKDRKPEACGLPERVCGPLPMSPGEFKPSFIDTIANTALSDVSDTEFSAWLRHDHTVDDVKSIDELIAKILNAVKGGLHP